MFRTAFENIYQNGYHPVVAEDRLPEPPAPPQRRARTVRQRGLDRGAVVEAAVRVLDAEGLEAVTLRRVAHELGVGAASLYAYVDSKDVLVELMLDHVLGEVDLSDLPDERPWQEQIKDAIRRHHATLVVHADIGRATLGRIPSGPNALRGMEKMLAVLRRSDLPDQVVAYAVDLIGLLVGAAAFEDSLFRESGVGLEEMMRFVGEFRRYLESLPRSRFPNLVELAGPLTRVSPDEDERFEFMLNVIVNGLAAQR
jgi:AcrR family transcriptional regulator